MIRVRSSSSMAQRQRGVALIAAVLVVALAVVLVAALLDTGESTRARSRNTQRGEQTWQLMRGLEGFATTLLRDDQRDSGGIDSADEPWAEGLPPLEIPGGRILGRLRPQDGCFNINSLLLQPEPSSPAYRRFEALLSRLGLDPAIAAQALDWIDRDFQPGSLGAEDGRYQAQQPAYRAANRRFEHVSELRLLAAVDADSYTTLLPHVCTLPPEATTNWNFATPALWMSLDDSISEADARRLSRDGRARYSSVEAIRSELGEDLRGRLLETLDSTASEFFLLEAQIVVDGIPYSYSSLLRREGHEIRVLARARGRL